ncbi:MAG: hypothetical protein KBB40_09465 [Clostridia bacterium]|jgi:hypothetical protein|nr:hypothetical protein [Clostridia bacterium]
MSKRVDKKKQRMEALKNKLKKALGIFFCIILLIFSVSIADMSARRMMMCNDDKYAIAVSLQEDSLLRVDIAGEKLMINIEPAVRISNNIFGNLKRYYDGAVKSIKSKIKE